MRVITGTARGRRLKEPSNYDIRPTTDKVKEAMFNILQFHIEGARVLDLFAGTGRLGIEALSRGAESCVFVDRSPEAVRIVTENLRATGLEAGARALKGDSLAYLQGARGFDLILMDPPYAGDLLEKALDLAGTFDILNKNGIIICESDRSRTLPELPEDRFSRREYVYGRVKLTAYTRNDI